MPRNLGDLLLVTVLACSLTLAACSASDSDGRHEVDEVDGMFTPDVDSWVMPLDSFNENLAVKGEVARQLVVGSCMEDSDYDYPDPVIEADRTETATQNSWEWRLFNEEIARTWGYTQDPRYDFEGVRQVATAVDTLAVAAPEEFSSCLQEGNSIPTQDDAGINPRALGAAAFRATIEDPDVQATVDRWKSCMAPQGIPDLPDDPSSEMPTAAMLARFGRPVDGLADNEPYRGSASADEIAVAVADAQCRESSGYTQTYYQEEWNRELQVVAENLDALERYREANKKYSAELDRVIAQNGG